MQPIQFYGQKNITSRRIQETRKRLGLSQDQLAARLQVMNVNMDQQILSRIERNLRIVTDYEVVCFARALGVSESWLLGGFDEIAAKSQTKG